MLPYAVTSYGILEPYSLSIPMFAPSIEFAIRANVFYDANDRHYCGETFKEPTWASGSQPFSPEVRSIEAQRHWLRFAEVYQLPHVKILLRYSIAWNI